MEPPHIGCYEVHGEGMVFGVVYPGLRTSEKGRKRADVLTLGDNQVTPNGSFQFGSLRLSTTNQAQRFGAGDATIATVTR
jgi:hypothetical protein